MRCGATGIGYTFETLIGKKEDQSHMPDYNGIEIKTLRHYSCDEKIRLFSLIPDGDVEYPIKRIVDIFGYHSKKYKEYKIFKLSINANEYKLIGYKRLKLRVNWENEKIELIAHTIFGEKIDVNVSWSFNYIKKVLFLKLNKLAIIKAEHKMIENNEYFKYNYIKFYKLKTFEAFIKLIEEGAIELGFNIDINHNQDMFGKIKDKGTSFIITEKNLEYLFEKI